MDRAEDVQTSMRAIKQAESARQEMLSALPEAESAISQAKANLDLAEVTFRRMQDLYTKRSISNQEFDEASARVKAARRPTSPLTITCFFIGGGENGSRNLSPVDRQFWEHDRTPRTPSFLSELIIGHQLVNAG